MADPAQQLREDRAMRDAARALVKGDIAFIRESLQVRSVPARLAARLGGGARDIVEEAAMLAGENRKSLGAGLAIGALGAAAWAFRQPLANAVGDLLKRAGWAGESAEPEAGSDRSGND